MLDSVLTYLPYLGWGAMALTIISTFSRTIIRLRGFAAASNVLSILASAAAGFWPSAIQNAVQLPVNLQRIREMRRLIDAIKAAPATGVHENWLVPFATPSRIAKDELLFAKGDVGDRLYYLVRGTIRLEEIDVTIEPGTLFGEVAFFTRNGRRTQTARAASDCSLLSMDGDQLKQLYFQNPEFGWYLVQLVAQRLTDNAARDTLRPSPEGAEGRPYTRSNPSLGHL